MQAPTKNPLPAIPEFFLYWAFQNPEQLRSRLICHNGATLKIVHPGYLSLGSGPDLQNALLKINNVMHQGDVEFHLHWQDWFRHGHHYDARYRQVILHVLWYPAPDLPASLSRRFPHLILSRNLRLPVSRWVLHMEALQKERENPISSSQVPDLPRLRQLAWQRFLRKCSELRVQVREHGWEQTLYSGLARVLGYRKNSAPFMQLINILPPQKLLEMVPPIQRSPMLFFVLLGWQSGLLHRALSREPVRQLISHIYRGYAHKLPFRRQKLIQWQFGRVRPFNSPYLRLAALAQFIHHYQHVSLFQHFKQLFEQRLPLSRLQQEVVASLRLPLSPTFTPLLQSLLNIKQIPAYTLGEQRIHQFTINILLPLFFLWAHHQNSPGFRWYIEDLYFQFPPTEDTHLLRPYQSRELPRRAFVQQALLEWVQANRTASSSSPVLPFFR